MRHARRRQAGNVIFIILIAVALLAALTFTVTRGSRNAGTISQEEAAIAANEILTFATQVEEAVQTLMVAGCLESQISFENTKVAGYTNASAPADKHCHVFDTAGGGIKWQAPRTAWLDGTYSANYGYGNYFYTATTCIPEVSTGNTGCWADGVTTDNDVTVFFPYVTLDICMAINNKLGISPTSGLPPADSGGAYTLTNGGKYTGSFALTGGDVMNSKFYGRATGCYKGSAGAPGYHFYKVLIAR